MRDQDRVAVLRLLQQIVDEPSEPPFRSAQNRQITRMKERAREAISALQSQQDGAQGGDAVVARIIHSPDAVSRMELTPEGLALGYGTHNVYARPAIAPREEQVARAIADSEGSQSIYPYHRTAAKAAIAALSQTQATSAAVDDAMVERGLAAFYGGRWECEHNSRAWMRAALTAALAPQSAQGES